MSKLPGSLSASEGVWSRGAVLCRNSVRSGRGQLLLSVSQAPVVAGLETASPRSGDRRGAVPGAAAPLVFYEKRGGDRSFRLSSIFVAVG